MRKTFRLVTSTALGAILVLSIGAGATFAGEAGKSGSNKPTVEKTDLGEAWCFDDVIQKYCFVREGRFTVTT